jgi:hypothetical protein
MLYLASVEANIVTLSCRSHLLVLNLLLIVTCIIVHDAAFYRGRRRR